MYYGSTFPSPSDRAHRSILLVALLTLGSLGLYSCGSDTVDPPDIVLPGPGEAVLYSKHIEPIWQNSCAGSACHIGGDESGLKLDTWQDVVNGSDFGAMVVPFSGARSHLFQHVNYDETLGPTAEPLMPISRDPLPIEQVKVIKQWIDEGAKNDNGDVPLAGDRPRLFVTCQSEDQVAVIDLMTQMVSRFISVGSRPDSTSPPEAPHNIVASPDGRYFYVNLIAAGIIEKYDAATFTKLGEAQVGLSPAQIQVTADGSTLYVSNFDLTFQQQFVNRVNAATMSNVTSIEVEGYAPHGVSLSPDESLLYTMNAGSDDISVIELSSGDVIARIPIVPGSPPATAGSAVHEPYQAEITSNGLMYVTCRKSNQVRVVDLQQRTVIDSIAVGVKPLILGLSPDQKELWIPNQGSNSLSVISTESRTVVATVSGLASQPHGVVFSSDGSKVFVSCENQTGGGNLHHPVSGTEAVPGIVYVIDRSSRSINRSIEVAGFAAGLVRID